MSTEMQEVAITNLSANVAPRHLYQQKLNPSFMLTFSGTVGRTLGCLMLTLVNQFSYQDYQILIAIVFAPLMMCYGALLILSVCFFSKLTENGKNNQLSAIYLNR